MAKKFIGVKLTDGLYEKLQEYKRKYDIDSDSEAVRDILRRFLIEKSERGVSNV